MDKSGEEVYKMLNYPNEDVRQAAVGAMAQFVISLSKSSAPEAAEGESNLTRPTNLRALLQHVERRWCYLKDRCTISL